MCSACIAPTPRTLKQLAPPCQVGSVRTASICMGILLVLSGSLPLTLIAAAATFGALLSLLALLVACGWALSSIEAVLACVSPALMTPPAALVISAYASSAHKGRRRSTLVPLCYDRHTVRTRAATCDPPAPPFPFRPRETRCQVLLPCRCPRHQRGDRDGGRPLPDARRPAHARVQGEGLPLL